MIASKAIVFFCLVTACHAYTYTGRGWTPWAWPASNMSPRATSGNTGRNWDDAAPTGGTKRIASLKDLWVGDVYHALWEKTIISQNIAAGSNLVKATWYRTERANLVAFKQAFPGIAVRFVDFAATEATVVSYMITSGASRLPTFTVSNLLIRAGLPTNYLTYTPYRMIGGYGSLEGAVTAAEVAVGFSPKDYGWDGLKRMITNLTCTQDIPSPATGHRAYDNQNRSISKFGAASCGYDPDDPLSPVRPCDDVIVCAEANAASSAVSAFPQFTSQISYPHNAGFPECGQNAFMWGMWINAYFTYTNKNDALVPRTVELYGNVTNAQVLGDGGTVAIQPDPPVPFDNYGCGLTEGAWHLIESEVLSATAPYSRTQWGANFTSGNWASVPVYNPATFTFSPSPSYAPGYTVLGLFLLNRWTCYY